MILNPTLDSAVSAITESFRAQPEATRPSLTVWTDFLRPLYMKDDPAQGAEDFNRVMEDPTTAENQDSIKHQLRQHLTDHPEALHKLQALLEEAENN